MVIHSTSYHSIPPRNPLHSTFLSGFREGTRQGNYCSPSENCAKASTLVQASQKNQRLRTVRALAFMHQKKTDGGASASASEGSQVGGLLRC
ncbi:hypothetical protein WG66_000070 [Moniliophthora roreri]|nr:hypothetical protein WG66_000070 [Moniliophthora roreri]